MTENGGEYSGSETYPGMNALGLCDDANPSSDGAPSTHNGGALGERTSAGAGESDDTRLRLIMEREPAAEDTDSLTAQTVRKMCEYIRESVSDSDIQSAAEYAFNCFARGRRDPFSLGWAAFWFVKHRVKRVLDEGALIRLGEPDQVDMLISPAVLIKMRDAAEDCDGFTMLTAALLAVAGVEQCIVTVSCDPRDRKRWSHVFGMVHLANGEWLPLDSSHGQAPGWMVPRNRLYRWQCWNLNGQPIDVGPPVRSGLRGYVYQGPRRAGYAYPRRGLSGLGQCTSDDEGNVTCPSTTDDSFLVDDTNLPVNPLDADLSALMTTGGVSINPATGAPASTSTLSNWGTALASLFSNAAQVASVAELPAGASLINGQVVGAGSTVGGLNVGSLLLIGLLLAGGLMVVSAMEGGKH